MDPDKTADLGLRYIFVKKSTLPFQQTTTADDSSRRYQQPTFVVTCALRVNSETTSTTESLCMHLSSI